MLLLYNYLYQYVKYIYNMLRIVLMLLKSNLVHESKKNYLV